MSDIIKTIRAEILRYRNKSAEELGVGFLESDKAKTFTNGWVAWVCERLLAFLDTLPEQAVEGLEEELEKEIDGWYNGMGIPLSIDALRETARHFAEWGAKHLKK